MRFTQVLRGKVNGLGLGLELKLGVSWHMRTLISKVLLHKQIITKFMKVIKGKQERRGGPEFEGNAQLDSPINRSLSYALKT